VSHSIGGDGEPPRRPRAPRVRVRRHSLQIAALTISVHADGAVSLDHRATGRHIASLLGFVDEADVGDLYTPAPRPRPVAVEFRGVRRVHRGPLRGELALRYRVVDPSIGRGKAEVDLTVNLVLDAGASFVRIALAGENRRENHRLRLVVRSDLAPTDVWADASFGAVRRERLLIGEAEAAVEQAPPTAPLHRYVSLFNESAGCTLISDGLAEYESCDDGSLLVTLVRGVGELSRNDLPERPGHAGWPTPTPKAQCLGPFAAGFAEMLHGPRVPSTIDAIEVAADEFLLPLSGATLRSALGLPAPVQGAELHGTGLAFSALKESEDGQWLVLRCVNLRDQDVDGSWRLPFDVSGARLARLDETMISDLATSGGK
jgi:alpha-mannosidase